MSDAAEERIKGWLAAVVTPVLVSIVGVLAMLQINRMTDSIDRLQQAYGHMSVQLATLAAQNQASQQQVARVVQDNVDQEHRITVLESRGAHR